MMRTLRDMNMSKFVAEDVPLFLSLIDDLFPGQNADRASFADVSSALSKACLPSPLCAVTLSLCAMQMAPIYGPESWVDAIRL